MCDLVLFAQFKKRKKHPWRSVTFTKVGSQYNMKEWWLENHQIFQNIVYEENEDEELILETQDYA